MNEWMMKGECKCECPKYNGKINEGTCLYLFEKGSSVIKAIRFIISHKNVINLGIEKDLNSIVQVVVQVRKYYLAKYLFEYFRNYYKSITEKKM